MDVSTAKKIRCLDGLRAISIALVLVSHQIYSNEEGIGFFYDAFDLGNLGVRIFFCISGFLIFQGLYAELVRTGKIDLFSFYVRRAARLMPVYFAYISVVALFAVFLGYSDELSSYIGALTYTRNMLGRGHSLTTHLWSLSVEEQFYFVLPVALLLLRRSAWLIAVFMFFFAACAVYFRYIAVDVASGFGVGRLLSSRSILMYMDCLFIGCLAGMVFAFKWGGNRFLGLVARVAFILVPFYVTPLGLYSWRIGYFIDAAVISGYIYFVSFRPMYFELRLLESRPFVYIGVISYSLYIWHFLFLQHFNKGIFGSADDFVVPFWWAISFFVAVFSYHVIESPLRSAIRKRFIGNK